MRPIQFTDGTSVWNPEMWDPDTEKFTVMAPASVPRNYHSVGMLLPDARVFSGGGGLNGNSCKGCGGPECWHLFVTEETCCTAQPAPLTAPAGISQRFTCRCRDCGQLCSVGFGVGTHPVPLLHSVPARTPTVTVVRWGLNRETQSGHGIKWVRLCACSLPAPIAIDPKQT